MVHTLYQFTFIRKTGNIIPMNPILLPSTNRPFKAPMSTNSCASSLYTKNHVSKKTWKVEILCKLETRFAQTSYHFWELFRSESFHQQIWDFRFWLLMWVVKLWVIIRSLSYFLIWINRNIKVSKKTLKEKSNKVRKNLENFILCCQIQPNHIYPNWYYIYWGFFHEVFRQGVFIVEQKL